MSKIEIIKKEILVIGGGAAGMASARKSAERGFDVLLVDRRSQLGGVLPQCIHDGFGLAHYGMSMTGPEYAAREIAKLTQSNVEIMLDTQVVSIREEDSIQYAILSSSRGIVKVIFNTCILATGCKERSIYSLPIAGTRPNGVFTAGEAQALLNLEHQDVGDNIVILGSGDIGMIMARQFKQLGKNVIAMIEQNSELGGLKRNIHSCIEAYDIPVIFNSTICELHGYPSLTAVSVRHIDSKACELITCDTLITSLGLLPDTELLDALGCDSSSQPSWLHCCGNAHYVHEIVDSVTQEAEKLAQEINLPIWGRS